MRRKCVTFDIDGTLALRGDRDPYDMTRVGEDLPNEPVVFLYRHLFSSFLRVPIHRPQIVLTSGRSEDARWQTEMWLDEHINLGLSAWDLLLMRKEGDNRPDYIVKQEMLDHLRDDLLYDVIIAFDDRNQVVKMWRDNDITCAQVAPGDF